MTSDERLALKWLHGEDHDRSLGIEPGRKALIKLLRNPPLSSEICAVHARMFEDVAVGEMRLMLSSRRGPGRPPKAQTVKGLAMAMKENNRRLVEASPHSYRRAKKVFRKAIKRKIRKAIK